MKNIIKFTIFLILVINIPIYGDTVDASSNRIQTSPETKLYFLEDSLNYLNIGNIVGSKQNAFKPIENDKVNLGYSDSTFWFKLQFKNSPDQEKNLLIESQYPLLEYVDVFYMQKGNLKEIKAGAQRKNFKSALDHYKLLVPYTAENGINNIYFRVKSGGPIVFKPNLWTYETFASNSRSEISLIWLFYGLMTALLLYNLFIYNSLKDLSFFALACFIFSATAFSLSYNGIGSHYIWSDNPAWSNFNHSFFLVIATISLIAFSQLYLDTKTNLPIPHRLLNRILFIAIPSIIMIPSLPISFGIRYSELIASVTAGILVFGVMFPMFNINKRQASFFSVSWMLFFLSAAILSMRNYGLLDETVLTTLGYPIFFAIGVMLLSISMSDKINIRQYTNKSILKTLKESEERYRLFFETAHDGIMYIIDGYPVFANRNMIIMTGYNEEEFYSMHVRDLFNREDDSNKDILNKKEDQKQVEAVLQNKDKENIDVLISFSSLKTGTSDGLFIIVTDISTVKKATKTIEEQYSKIEYQFTRLTNLNEELLHTQESLVIANRAIEREKEYLSAILSSIADGVIACDMNGYVLLMNKIAEGFTGFSQDSAIGMDVRNIIRLKDIRSGWIIDDSINNTELTETTKISIPFEIIDEDGKYRIIELKSSTINHNNVPIGKVLALRDITIKTKIDEEINKMTKLESIGVLAGGIAHDFNNLLTGISGNISIAKNKDCLDNETIENLHEIEKATVRATALTKQLLTFAKGGEPVVAPSSIDDIIKESVKFLIKNPEIVCSMKIEKNLSAVMIDANQISQAINNLLINSLQAMSDGGKIKIEAHNAITIPPDVPLKDGQYIVIKISDTGNGISQKNLKNIFDPFFTTKKTGTGLGLSSTYSIVKKHKGFIKVDSKEGVGTTFSIYLKRTESLVYDDKKIETEREKSEKRSTGKILVMDDEGYIRNVAAKMLKQLDYEAECVKNGEEAIEQYRKKYEEGSPYWLVILDLNVHNGMGGKDAIRELRAIDKDIKAIVSSGYSDSPVMARYQKYGFSGVLKKPYNLDDLIEALDKIV